ncbi:uncharacterized protein CTRU02_202515 [Colletotrichum truncatum]|uniref:Uncharacterized protein n=1 Tax=Colletotrichum truncatum TaxID=5467 RepID=A0ACC3ZKX1_COLTU|nr:uncharacterized protein CTRU02_01684 [Colletotrichum truncatum]KAF6800005.1 hypothetical protein CTRU02_01684 [Colletotrichum truncatum]
MGLLKFFSSKKSSEKSANAIRSQAYDATAPSLPPTLGTYPVAGNGPTNVFEDLQRSHHKMSETNLSLAAGSETSVPVLPAPRFRDASVERPSSAPNGAGPSSASLSSHGRRDSSRGPQLSFRRLRVGSMTSSTGSPVPRRVSHSPVVSLENEPFSPPKAPFAHSRHFSMQSNSSMARNFIDILDAQSEIKPSGFQNRVKAAGVRDYGEDVADRNIGVNGVNLASEKVQEFYAKASSPRDRRDGAITSFGSRTQFADQEQLSRPYQGHESINAGARTLSLTSGTLSKIPFQTILFSPERSQRHEKIVEDVPQSTRNQRRQSLGSYIPTTPSNGPLGLRISATDTPVSSNNRRTVRHSATSEGSPVDELGIYTSQPNGLPLSLKASQKPAYVVRQNYSLPVQQRPKTSSQAEMYQAVRPPSRGGSVANSTLSSPTLKSPSKRHTLSATGTTFRHGEWLRSAKPDEGNGTRGWVGRVEVESHVDSAEVSSPAPSPHVMRSGHSWRDGQDERLNSHGSPFGKVRLDEIYEHVPMRRSSLRHWSISSATPTMSSSSSFHRPQSRHTTTTSVDLATMSSFMNDSLPSLHSRSGDHTSFTTALESSLPSPLDPIASGAGFNIDDYLSSDDDIDADSFITTRYRNSGVDGSHEADLLFDDTGYGIGGLQLPGLFDSLVTVPDPTLTSPSHPSIRRSNDSPIRLQRRLSLDPRVEAPIFSLGEETGEEDVEPDEYNVLPVRADLALGRRGTRRISAIGTTYQRIEEEKEEKVDVRAAVRLRKEAKARQRAMARIDRLEKRKALVTDSSTEAGFIQAN